MNIHTCMQNILDVYLLLSIAVEQERQRGVAKVHRCLQKYRKKRILVKEKKTFVTIFTELSLRKILLKQIKLLELKSGWIK